MKMATGPVDSTFTQTAEDSIIQLDVGDVSPEAVSLTKTTPAFKVTTMKAKFLHQILWEVDIDEKDPHVEILGWYVSNFRKIVVIKYRDRLYRTRKFTRRAFEYPQIFID